MTDLQVYDTTLRDGAQQEGLNLSVTDKLAIAMHLAINSSGHLLWKTDPWKDNKLPAYRTNRPTIVTFYTTEKSSKKHKKKDVYNEYYDNPNYIAIGYSNSQFGYILKKNGSFKFMGQD